MVHSILQTIKRYLKRPTVYAPLFVSTYFRNCHFSLWIGKGELTSPTFVICPSIMIFMHTSVSRQKNTWCITLLPCAKKEAWTKYTTAIGCHKYECWIDEKDTNKWTGATQEDTLGRMG